MGCAWPSSGERVVPSAHIKPSACTGAPFFGPLVLAMEKFVKFGPHLTEGDKRPTGKSRRGKVAFTTHILRGTSVTVQEWFFFKRAGNTV